MENPLRIGGSKATEKIDIPQDVRASEAFAGRVAARLMTREQFIERHASGTLRKNLRVGMDGAGHYLHERVAFEFGWCFEAADESRVTWGQPISFPDCKPLTEAGWHIDRYATIAAFPGDEFETKYVIVEYPDGKRREGLGLVCRKTSAPFVPARHMVYAIIAEWDAKSGEFLQAVNPC